jgi:chemotaxis signal transduction protein
MTNAYSAQPFSPEKQTEKQREVKTDKYITFKLADYLLALPSEGILKIVSTPPPSQGGMVSMGLVQLEQYSIQIIDLIKLLSLKGQDDIVNGAKKSSKTAVSTAAPTAPTAVAPQNPPFLIVIQDIDQNLWGIAVNEPPDLMDIPRYALKPVPAEKRLTRALRWVSHIVTYDLGGDRHTLLLLDMSVLLSHKQVNLTSDPRFSEIAPPLEAEIEAENTSIRKTEMYA